MNDNKHLIESVEKGVKPYEELRLKEGAEFKHGWGNIIYKGKPENVYTSEAVIYDWISEPILKSLDTKKQNITLVDFGGAAGATLEIVAKQLGRENVQKYDVDINKEALERGRKNSSSVHFIESPLSKIPIDDNFFDAGYSRFALQYNPFVSEAARLPTQADLLREWYRVMKPGSALVIIWPAAKNKKEYQAYNEYSAVIQAYVSGRNVEEVLRQRSLTDAETVIEMAKSVGFGILDYSRRLKMNDFSPEQYWDRFGEKMKQHGATLEGLREVQESAFKKYAGSVTFVEVDGHLTVDTGSWRIVLKK